MRKGFEQGIVIKVVFMLVFLAVGIGVLMVNKGKAEELTSLGRNLIGKLSPCDDLGTVDFDTFMGAMESTYKACDESKDKCGYSTCKKMTLDLGAQGLSDGTYHMITAPVLKSWGLDKFNVYDDTRLAAFGANIYCEQENDDWNAYEIDVYPKGITGLSGPPCDRQKTASNSWLLWVPTLTGIITQWLFPSYFVVGDGSEIKLEAIKQEELLATTVDLKVTVNGGKFSSRQDAKLRECKSASDCKTPWAACKGKICEYGFCAQNSVKCKPSTATCKLNGECINPPTTSCDVPNTYFNPAGNKFKATPTGLEKDKNGKFLVTVKLENAALANSATPFPIKQGDDDWFREMTVSDYAFSYVKAPIRRTDSNDARAKVSVWVKNVEIKSDGTYEVKLIQGCY